MNLKEIKEMIALMNENNLNELEIEREGMRIKLKKMSEGIESVVAQGNTQTRQIITPQVLDSVEKQAREEAKKNLVEIKAPMVGTFYRAPAPEALPFVEEGKEINIGEVLCIVEAMKLMNEIKSEVKGVIKEILIENGRPVEFGQTLFLVEPTA